MSETTNLKLFKHDNPETNTEKFNVDKALNENWDKIDEGIGAIIAENERLKQDLNGLPTGQAEGESIDLTDSADMRFSSFGIRGNSRQESRSGKNLLNIRGKTIAGGITATYGDGKVTFSGTATQNWSDITIFQECNFKAGTYTFSIDKTMNYNITIRCIHEDESYSEIRISSGEKSKTATFDKDIVQYRMFITGFTSGTVISEITLYWQFESGTTASKWEQPGASPSPDYPSEVESCGDNVNLFNGELIGGTFSNGVPNTDMATIRIRNNEYISTNINTEYTINAEYSKTLQVNVLCYDTDKKYVKETGWNTVPYTVTTGSTTKYIMFVFRDSSNTTITTSDIIKVKVEKGSKLTLYSPYGQGSIDEVVCNENLYTDTLNVIKTNTTDLLYVDRIVKCNKGQRIYVALNGDGTFGNVKGTNMYFRYQSETNDSLYDWKTGVDFGKGKYIDCEYDDVYIGIRVGGFLNYKDLMISKGEITNYIQHQSQTSTIPTQQPMRAIGDTRDTFVKVDGKWVERHNIFRRIFDGTTNKFTSKSSSTNNNLFITNAISNILVPKNNDTTIGLLSNYFKEYDTNNLYLNDLTGISIRTSADLTIGFGLDSEITTVELANAYLQSQYNAGTPVYVDYILATPTDIECTPEQTAILDEIENTVKSYKGVTHIYSIDNVGANVEVTYYKDIDTMINDLNTAIIALGGV